MKITKRSWKEKLQDVKDFPRIAPIPEKIRHKWGKVNLVIPSPLEVNALMEQIPPGKLTTIGCIREFLARSHGVEMACPLTTGIFVRIAAEAAMESEKEGHAETTPWWRTLQTDGSLHPKFPGAIETQMLRLEKEGHTILSSKYSMFIQGCEKKLHHFH